MLLHKDTPPSALSLKTVALFSSMGQPKRDLFSPASAVDKLLDYNFHHWKKNLAKTEWECWALYSGTSSRIAGSEKSRERLGCGGCAYNNGRLLKAPVPEMSASYKADKKIGFEPFSKQRNCPCYLLCSVQCYSSEEVDVFYSDLFPSFLCILPLALSLSVVFLSIFQHS